MRNKRFALMCLSHTIIGVSIVVTCLNHNISGEEWALWFDIYYQIWFMFGLFMCYAAIMYAWCILRLKQYNQDNLIDQCETIKNQWGR